MALREPLPRQAPPVLQAQPEPPLQAPPVLQESLAPSAPAPNLP
jgi:hypothetical protein